MPWPGCSLLGAAGPFRTQGHPSLSPASGTARSRGPLPSQGCQVLSACPPCESTSEWAENGGADPPVTQKTGPAPKGGACMVAVSGAASSQCRLAGRSVGQAGWWTTA